MKISNEYAEMISRNIDMTISYLLGEESNIVFQDSGQISTRTEFPESWLWVDYKLPLCPGSNPNW